MTKTRVPCPLCRREAPIYVQDSGPPSCPEVVVSCSCGLALRQAPSINPYSVLAQKSGGADQAMTAARKILLARWARLEAKPE